MGVLHASSARQLIFVTVTRKAAAHIGRATGSRIGA
jgi:hypothetical protein